MPQSRAERIGIVIGLAALVAYVVTGETVLGTLFLFSILFVVLHHLFTGGVPADPAVRRLRGDPEPGAAIAKPAGWGVAGWLWYLIGLVLFFGLIFVGMAVAGRGF